jgi:acyl-coenzyme A synthetase/AMP-(fatty) acid ligase
LDLDKVFTDSVRQKRVRDDDGPLEHSAIEKRIAALQELGVRPRESVGVSLDNGRSCIETYIAIARVGAVAVPLPPDTSRAERSSLMTALGCRVIATGSSLDVVPEVAPFRSWPDDIHWILHSSGSTGRPKAIALSWSAVRKNALDTVSTLGVEDDRIHLGSMSQCYANGLFNSFLLPLVTGGSVHLGPIASIANFGAYTRAFRRSHASVHWVNPTLVSIVKRRFNASDFTPGAILVSCTAPLSKRLCLESEEKLHRPVLQSYGLAETLIVSVERPSRDAEKEFSAGAPVGGPHSVSTSSEGTLEIVNGAVTPGYVRMDGAVKFELPNGIPGERFSSADYGFIGDDGNLTVTGRVTGVINVGGTKLSAEHLEEVIRGFPGVRNAVVVPVTSADGYARAGALIEADSSVELEQLALHCVAMVGRFARPAVIRQVQVLPLTANGKPDRARIATILRSAQL